MSRALLLGGCAALASCDAPAACLGTDAYGCIPECFATATCYPPVPPTPAETVYAPLVKPYPGEPLRYNNEIPVYYVGVAEYDAPGMVQPAQFKMVDVSWPDGTIHRCSEFWLRPL